MTCIRDQTMLEARIQNLTFYVDLDPNLNNGRDPDPEHWCFPFSFCPFQSLVTSIGAGKVLTIGKLTSNFFREAIEKNNLSHVI